MSKKFGYGNILLQDLALLGGEQDRPSAHLSPERIQTIDDQLKKSRESRKGDIDSSTDQSYRSPFHRAKKHIRNFVGGKSMFLTINKF